MRDAKSSGSHETIEAEIRNSNKYRSEFRKTKGLRLTGLLPDFGVNFIASLSPEDIVGRVKSKLFIIA